MWELFFVGAENGLKLYGDPISAGDKPFGQYSDGLREDQIDCERNENSI